MGNVGEHLFIAEVAKLDFGRIAYSVLYVPDAVQQKLGAGTRARVVGMVGGMPFRGGLLPAGGGRHYLLLSKKFLKAAGLAVGDTTTACLSLDDPDAVELVPEFERALSANPRAWRAWERMTPGARRGLAHRVASAKQPATRLARIEECIDTLCRNSADE